jgi:hypothetical protein
LLIELDYRGHRIEVTAQRVDGAWDAEVRIRRTFSEDKPHVERVRLSQRRVVGRSAAAIAWRRETARRPDRQ